MPHRHPFDRLRRAFTARTTVLSLITLLTASLTVATIVPQTAPDTAAGALPARTAVGSSVVELLGLNHVFSTWWFVALSLLFLVSLLFSTVDQYGLSRARTRQLPQGGAGEGEPLSILFEEAVRILRREGYRRVAGNELCARYVRLSFGYWGSFLLHLGMMLTVFCSLVYVLTEHRVIARVASGERVPLVAGEYAERRGLLGRALPLPAAVELVRAEPEFWENDQVKSLSSEFVFIDGQGGRQPIRIGVNDAKRYRGLLVYHQNSFGNTFYLEFKGEGSGSAVRRLDLPMPVRRDKAGYGAFDPGDGRYRFKVKYFADAAREKMKSADPLLVLRLYEGERLVAEGSLRVGGSAVLGPFTVRLAGIGWWTDLLFEGSRGTAGIFAGFFLLLCGGMLSYFVVPREVLLRRTEMGYSVTWRVARFPEFYREERARVLALCRGEEQK